MNTFKIRKEGIELYINKPSDDIVLKLENEFQRIAIPLSQYDMDALRNYLDDLETEE